MAKGAGRSVRGVTRTSCHLPREDTSFCNRSNRADRVTVSHCKQMERLSVWPSVCQTVQVTPAGHQARAVTLAGEMMGPLIIADGPGKERGRAGPGHRRWSAHNRPLPHVALLTPLRRARRVQAVARRTYTFATRL
ncbi:hypothetical protein AAFF_G00407780 [Aldrovandia affinis]|uniref:Uncharacterized protein n=1 Tax=Aldrovandia affinis TaxID=143900 RepID=A0AAD7WK04_9TELE|nr:hypothetical protein AAFF_G00407780 [Aldrovandia affinis]